MLCRSRLSHHVFGAAGLIQIEDPSALKAPLPVRCDGHPFLCKMVAQDATSNHQNFGMLRVVGGGEEGRRACLSTRESTAARRLSPSPIQDLPPCSSSLSAVWPSRPCPAEQAVAILSVLGSFVATSSISGGNLTAGMLDAMPGLLR
jgi:hypothetical protein